MRGDYFLPNKHLLYAAQVQSQEMYPQIISDDPRARRRRAADAAVLGGGFLAIRSSRH
jgi:hypothetical protein